MKNGRRILFFRIVTSVAILLLGIVAVIEASRLHSVEQKVDPCRANGSDSLACKVDSCIRAQSINLSIPACRAVTKQAQRLHIIPPLGLPPSHSVGPTQGGGPSNPPSGHSQPTPPSAFGGGGGGSGSSGAAGVRTPSVPILGQPKVCDPLVSVNC